MAPADGKASSAQIALLMSAVVVFGTLNNFTGRIRAETLKAYDGTVATIVDSMVYFLFSACVLLVPGKLPQPSLPASLRRSTTPPLTSSSLLRQTRLPPFRPSGSRCTTIEH